MKKNSEEKKTVVKTVASKAKKSSEKNVTVTAKKSAAKPVSTEETVVKKTVDKIIAASKKNAVKAEQETTAPIQKKPVAKAEKKPVAKAEKKPVAKAEKKPVAKAEKKPVAKAEKKPVAKAEKKPVAKAEKKPVAKAELPLDDDNAKKRSRKPKIDRKLKMTKIQQKHYRDLLLKLRKEYSDQISFHQNEALITRKDANGERAGSATHMADLGSDTSRRDMELSLLNDESDIIQMIDVALQKLEASEYGICIECGCVIPAARLEAKPYARYCTACKAKMEKCEDPQRRHR